MCHGRLLHVLVGNLFGCTPSRHAKEAAVPWKAPICYIAMQQKQLTPPIYWVSMMLHRDIRFQTVAG